MLVFMNNSWSNMPKLILAMVVYVEMNLAPTKNAITAQEYLSREDMSLDVTTSFTAAKPRAVKWSNFCAHFLIFSINVYALSVCLLSLFVLICLCVCLEPASD